MADAQRETFAPQVQKGSFLFARHNQPTPAVLLLTAPLNIAAANPEGHIAN